MSSINGRMTDLFIPIGRPQSSSSTTKTNASIDNSNASTVSKMATMSPATTVSSTNSSRNTTLEPVKSGSPSSNRYTISGPAPDVRSRRDGTVTDSSRPKPERPNSVHIRRHSQKINGSRSPFEELTRRLSQATSSGTRGQPRSSPNTVQPSNSTIGRPTADRSAGVGTMPALSNPESNKFENSQLPTSTSSSPSRKQEHTLTSTEVYPPDVAPVQLLRSHSQSSSRSNRSCPPASFPSGFYEKSSNQTPAGQPPSRPAMALAMDAAKPTRSTSPLKFEVSGRDIVQETPSKSRRPSHRRHLSDSTFSVRSRHSAISSNGPTDLMRASFHATIHYYTSCPHISPPCTRPLDTSPRLDTSCEPPRSRIEGSCFDCDTADRRETEAAILMSFNPRIASHLNDLDTIVAQLESISPISPAESTSQIRHLSLDDGSDYMSSKSTSVAPDEQNHRPDSPSSAVSEDEENIPILVRMQVLQERITVLTIQRDKEVRELWRGYSQRWGPGTIGLLKGVEDHSTIGTPGTPRSRSSVDSGRSYHTPAEGRMKVDWIRDEKKQLD